MKTLCGTLSGVCWLLVIGIVGGIEHGSVGMWTGFAAALALVGTGYLLARKAGAVS